MKQRQDLLSILHIVISIGETSAPYNEHCLPLARERKIAVCTFFPPKIAPAPEIALFAGNGTLGGFFRAVKAALAHQPYDLVHVHAVHVALLYWLSALWLFNGPRPPTVYTVHTSYPTYELRHRLMSIPVFAFFDKVVCCSVASFHSFPPFYKWLAGERLCAVPNGLDLVRVDRIAAKTPRLPAAEQTFTVIAIGRLVEVKNPQVIVQAFQQSADQTSRLVYIGDGPLHAALVAQSAAGDQPARIEFTGLIPREQVFPYLLNADLFISASWGEGLPVAVLEAMACRCPVLLSAIPSHQEIATGVDFIPLVPANDVAGFARELAKLRAMSRAERAAVGQRCRKLVEERFSLTAMQAGYDAVYAELLSARPQAVLEAR